jgi:hypothetical protein
VSLLRDAEGRVRAPYVVGVFVVIAVAVEGLSTLVLGMLGLLGFEDLDSPRVLFSSGKRPWPPTPLQTSSSPIREGRA